MVGSVAVAPVGAYFPLHIVGSMFVGVHALIISAIDYFRCIAYHNSMALPEKKPIGPRRLITEAVKLGEWGQSRWHVVLECGHSLDRKRKPKIGADKVSCISCLDYSPAGGAEIVSVEDDIAMLPDEYDAYSDMVKRATIASHFGVQLEQVEMQWDTATVYLDSVQIKRILDRSL